MQLSRIPSYEEANLSAEFPSSPLSNLSRRIDQTKLKTKVCRYYLLGTACPYGNSCAFSHSDAAAKSSQPASPTSANSEDLTKSSGSGSLMMGSQGSDCAEDTVVVVPERVVFGQPPPSYEIALKDTELLGAMTMEEEIVTPPAYPRRFRFDPYNVNWIAYEE